MSDLLSSLVLEDFRGFRLLELSGLRRLNLVVGRNNCGKTSLLEAFRLLTEPTRAGDLAGLLRAASGTHARTYFRWLIRNGADAAALRGTLDGGGEREIRVARDRRGVEVAAGGSGPFEVVPDPPLFLGFHPREFPALSSRVVSTQTRDPKSVVVGFGRAVRKRGGEEIIQDVLKKLDPRIQRVRIVVDDDGEQILVDVGLTESLPLAQVGQGVYRLVAILSDIVGSGAGLTLIDEIENGLHHSALRDVFVGLAEVATTYGVQLVLTTHSAECIRAAHEAMSDRSDYELAVIQLFRLEKEGVQGRVLGREQIQAAVAGEIDLR